MTEMDASCAASLGQDLNDGAETTTRYYRSYRFQLKWLKEFPIGEMTFQGCAFYCFALSRFCLADDLSV